LVFLCFFFFQAEDGIRDATVTGVQTCALPISDTLDVFPGATVGPSLSTPLPSTAMPCEMPLEDGSIIVTVTFPAFAESVVLSNRSEERRVGKECRCMWERCYSEIKQ